jgi:glycosyltransferase involved in cell wall biosynthesis
LKISVLIPAYNCQATIRETLDSVLAQTRQPDEVLVVDDGSTDQTPEILNSYGPGIKVFRQENQGVGAARNTLLERAQGELIAWLDSDDVWHPRCLETHARSFADHHEAGALFVDHLDFLGTGRFEWNSDPTQVARDTEVIHPLDFFRRIMSAPGKFMSAFCCLTPRAVRCLGGLVAPATLRSAEDFYMVSMLAVKGLPVVYAPYPLVAYRVREGSLSRKATPLRGSMVEAFRLLEPHFRSSAPGELLSVFEAGYAGARRRYAKELMGDGHMHEARTEICRSLTESSRPDSLFKSLGLLALTYCPRRLRPKLTRPR